MKLSKTGKAKDAKLTLFMSVHEHDALSLCRLAAELNEQLDPVSGQSMFVLRVYENKFGVSGSKPIAKRMSYAFPIDKIGGVAVHALPDFGATECKILEKKPGEATFQIPPRSELRQYRTRSTGKRKLGFTKIAENASNLADSFEMILRQMEEAYYAETGRRVEFKYRHDGSNRPVIYSPQILGKTY